MIGKQNAHLTFKENVLAGRHGWIRLTPAYSYRLVEEALASFDRTAVILDPFSGSGTTGLVAAELGFPAVLVDVNPFLVWLARVKTRNYGAAELDAALQLREETLQVAARMAGRQDLWIPPMHQVERWWPPGRLHALAALRAGLDKLRQDTPWFDLLEIALCRVVIAVSTAAFNHQSMSFQAPRHSQLHMGIPNEDEAAAVLSRFRKESDHVIKSARSPLAGRVEVVQADSRSLAALKDASVDVLYSSPPYVNRMSYIRELRPYMYWLRFLDRASEAGELDWKAIGGTWGVATSRLKEWEPTGLLPLPELKAVLTAIRDSSAPNAELLARYIHKYFEDMHAHFGAARRVVRAGGQVVYVIGNSVFYGVVVPAERWYAELLAAEGFADVQVRAIRKRNSKKELYEYIVSAARP